MSSLCLLILALASSARSLCPPPGPLLPPPVIRSSDFSIPDATFNNLPWLSDTSFVVKVQIGHAKVFQYVHSAPGYHDAAISLQSKKMRIGSVTKLYTVLAIKITHEKIGWEDPIGKFIPELAANAAYRHITIGNLAGHTSGLGRFGYVGDLATIPGFQPAQFGIPAASMTLPGCDAYPGGRVCTSEELLKMYNTEEYEPVSVNSGPLYSNVAFNLLGLALENVYRKRYEQVIQDLIFTPLKLTNSTFVPPTDKSTTLLPIGGDKWFVHDFANYNPAGGIWTTADDMMTFMRALATHHLLSAVETRRWLQPYAILPSTQQLVGAPWEILRPTTMDVKFSRPIDMYTKAGGIKGYAAWSVLVPEFDLVVTLNAAGNSSSKAVQDLLPLIMSPIIAYADANAREQAKSKYAGTYTTGDDSITLTVDNGPGLAITAFTMGGVEVMNGLAALRGVAMDNFSARLYPTDADSLGTSKEIWTINLDTITTAPGFADLNCNSWNNGDHFRYMKERLDTLVFEIGPTAASETSVISVSLQGWRTVLKKDVYADFWNVETMIPFL